jgi:hypothetical protein
MLTLYKFYVLLTVHLDHLCNENQPDALFILNLFRQATSICRRISSGLFPDVCNLNANVSEHSVLS